MTLVVCWLVFPAVLVLLALGCGLLIERVAGMPLPGALLPPVGLAVIVVAVQLTTYASSTAKLSAPLIVVLAGIGLVTAAGRRHRRLDPFAIVAAAAVFAVFSAPTVLSGEATFAGYIKLDDTATWLALIDRVMDHGRDVSGLPPSSYQATVDFYLGHGYPVGSLLPLGVSRPLVGQDLAWLFQPYLATLAALLSLSLYALLAPLMRARAVRALSVFVASQSALLFGYALWGGVKELATAYLLALTAALVPGTVAEPRGASLLPLAVSSAAILAVLNISGAAWLLPTLVVALVAVVRLQRRLGDRGFRPGHVVSFCALALVLSVPSLATAGAFRKANSVLTDPSDLQNLLRPLRAIQIAGVWPSEDFRSPPNAMGLTYLLVLAVVSGAVLGLVWASERRAWGLLLYVGAALTGWLAIAHFGSPWVDAKALATASPALPLAGMAGAAALGAAGRRLGAILLAAAIGGGVLWSNALAYHDVSLAPRARLAELERIGERIRGRGPTLMTEYEPYGDRHFLRDADAEGASDLRRRPVPLRTGRLLPKGQSADLDRFELSSLLVYRTLVIRRSPAESRPPAPYRLIRSGKYYEVWQRPLTARPVVLTHLPLGDRVQAGAVPSCAQVWRLARMARSAGATLVAPQRARSVVAEPARAPHPRGWENHPPLLYATHPGSVHLRVQIRHPGRYGVWLGGSFGRGFDVSLDGRSVGTARFELSNAGQYLRVGEATLGRGAHEVTLRYGDGDLRPGTSARLRPLGPLILSPASQSAIVQSLHSRDTGRLCGTSLDWIEVVRP